MFYRWLGFYELFRSETEFTDLPPKVKEKIQSLIERFNISKVSVSNVSDSKVSIKKSNNKQHIAYVWGDTLMGETRLVLSDGFLQLDDYEQVCVLNHELAHIKRRDWLKSELLFLICAVFWWLPPVWKVRKQAEVLAELACDDYFVETMIAEGQSTKKVYSQSTTQRIILLYISLACVSVGRSY